MNDRCEIWDEGKLWGTGLIKAYVSDKDGFNVIVQREDGWLMAAQINCVKIVDSSVAAGPCCS